MILNNIEKQFGILKGNCLTINFANECFELVKDKKLNFINFIIYTFSYNIHLPIEVLSRYINESIEVFGIDYVIKKAIYFDSSNCNLFTKLVLQNEQCNPNKLNEYTFFDQYRNSNFKEKDYRFSRKMTPYGGIYTHKIKSDHKITKTKKLEEVNARRSYKKKERQLAKKEINYENY